jgi:hypothetical protein
MRKLLLSLAVSVASFSGLYAQNESVLEYIDATPITPLPYNVNNSTPKRDQLIEPRWMQAFPYELWNGKFNIELWHDFNQHQSRPNNDLETVAIYRRLPSATNYHLCVLVIYCYGDEDSKKMMVTVNPATGALIDQLEVGYSVAAKGMSDYRAYTKEFFVETVNNETIVSISQMKLENNQTHPISLTTKEMAYLTKRKYKINNTTGKFELIPTMPGRIFPRLIGSHNVFSKDSQAFK